jgi:hypothetical protein
MRHRLLITLAMAMLSAGTAQSQQQPEVLRPRAWASVGVGPTSSGGSILRIGVEGSLGPVLVSARHQNIGTGFEKDGSGSDLAVLFGLRTTGRSFLSATLGPVIAQHVPTCSMCAIADGSGVAYEIGAHAAAPWFSLAVIYTDTRAGKLTSWHGVIVSVGIGKLR